MTLPELLNMLMDTVESVIVDDEDARRVVRHALEMAYAKGRYDGVTAAVMLDLSRVEAPTKEEKDGFDA